MGSGGGALCLVTLSKSLTLDGLTLQDNQAKLGGAVFLDASGCLGAPRTPAGCTTYLQKR